MKNAYFVYRGTKKPRIDGHKGSQLSNKPIGKGTKKSKSHRCGLDFFVPYPMGLFESWLAL